MTANSTMTERARSRAMGTDDAPAAARSAHVVSEGLADWVEGLRKHRVWMHLALTDVRLKYRRTALGPFWITASTGILILAISAVFSQLLGRKLSDFVPFGAAGIIAWYFIASVLAEGCLAIVSSATVYQSIPAPYSLSILRMLFRNLIVFAHNFIIFVALAVLLGINFLPAVPALLVSLLLVTANAGWMATLLAVLTARYRDVQQLVSSAISILFLVTPVFWEKSALEASWIFVFNPFTYAIDAIRGPLIGADGWGKACVVLACLAPLGWLAAVGVLGATRRRIVFWL